MKRVLFKSESVEHPTPKDLFEKLHAEFNFNFDPCPLRDDLDRLALAYANEMDGTARLYNSWRGKRVFCNPPYGKELPKFLECAEDAELAVFLIPARTDTRWFHDIVLPKAQEIRFIRGRLKFREKDPNWKPGSGTAPFPSMIVIFGVLPFTSEESQP